MSRSGISVMEVVIVLAVLIMAAGVMLPVIAGGRRQARILSCAENLTTIEHGMEAFLQEHQGRYPSGPLAGGQELAGNNLLGVAGKSQWPSAVTMTPASDRPLNRYVSESLPTIARVARCPMDVGDSLQAQDRTLFEAVGCSYVYPYRSPAQEAQHQNVVLSGIWAIQGHHRSEITHPDRKLILADTIIMANRPATDAYNQWHNRREPLEANILFADGHVANLPRITASAAQPNEHAVAAPDEIERLGSTNTYY